MTDIQVNEINVRVAVRVRPFLPRERLAGEEQCVRFIADTKQIVMGKDKAFTFDNIFAPKSQQVEVYDACVAGLVENIFEGYNSTVFAYGQTGSGKTYTVGTSNQEGLVEEEQGIIPRAVDHMYKLMESKSPGVQFTVQASFIEIYKEEVRDLLDLGSKEIHIREDERANTIVCGVHEHACATREDLLDCLETGCANRVTGATQMNEYSSRSHCVFTVTIVQEWRESLASLLNRPTTGGSESARSRDELQHCIAGKFHFVDLAGSERAHKTGNVGDRFKESIHINSGLLALGNVISALGDTKRKRPMHIPYRESKITRILKDSLGGNARTVMVCCVSPAWSNYDESVNALKYANRARNIRNRPVINRDKTSIKMEEMQSEIMALRDALSRQKSTGPPGGLQTYEEEDSDPYSPDVKRLRLQCDHYLLLVSKAKDYLEALVDSRVNLSDSQEQTAREWLDLAAELENRVPDTLSKERWESVTVNQLRRDLEKVKHDLSNDEDIFSEMSKENVEKQERITNLERQVAETQHQLEVTEERCRAQEVRLVEQQGRLDQLRRQTQLNSVSESQEIPMGPEGDHVHDQLSGRRVKSVPAHRQPRKSAVLETAASTRDIKTSPALFSIDRVMQNFRAQSQLLASQLEDEDEVLRQEFEDAKSAGPSRVQNGGITHSGLERRGTYRLTKSRFTSATSAEPRQETYSALTEDPLIHEAVSGAVDQYKKQIKMSQLRLAEANQKMRDLSMNIRMKEQLIKELVKSSKDTGILNKKYEDKIRDLEIVKEQTTKELLELQRKLEDVNYKSKGEETLEMRKVKEDYEKKMDETEKKLQHLQKKQRETEKMASYTTNHEKKIQDLVITIERMKQDQINLQKRLREESDNKIKLEKDLQKDNEKIKQLEIKSEHQQKVLKRKQEEIAIVQKRLRKGSGTGLGDEQDKIEEQRRWLDEEVEKVLLQKRQMEELEQELRRREDILVKKEDLLAEKAELQMRKLRASQTVDKDYEKVSARLDSTERELLEKQRAYLTTPERNRGRVEEEMKTLKTERDRLHGLRRGIEQKLQSGGVLNDKEERRMIELDEAIETLDEAIQYKDEAIRNKKEALRRSERDVATSREDLFGRLRDIDPEDARTLLIRYFDKVVGLREESRQRELANSELEVKLEENQRLTEQLERSLERQTAEMDRRMTQLQQEYEREKQVLVQQLAGSSVTPIVVEGATPDAGRLAHLEKELLVYKKTCRELKKKIKEWVLCGRLVADIDLGEVASSHQSQQRPSSGTAQGDSRPNSGPKHYHAKDYAAPIASPRSSKPGVAGSNPRWERIDSASTGVPAPGESQTHLASARSSVGATGSASGAVAGYVSSRDGQTPVRVSKRGVREMTQEELASRRSQLSVYDSLEDVPQSGRNN